MPPKQDPVPRARSAVHWLAGLLLLGFLAAGVVTAGVLLWENVDVQRLARTAAAVGPEKPPPALPPHPAAFEPAAFEAAVFVSAASAGFFPDTSFHPRVVRAWEAHLTEVGARVRRVDDASRIAALGSRTLLVAPDAVCLSRQERRALAAHVARGGGLVIDWATGARDQECRWIGWDPVRELTGAIDVVEIEPRPAVYLAIPGGLPLSAGLDPGTRVELRPEAHLALLVPGPRLYWSDWALNPAPAAAAPEADAAALLRRSASGGRVVWFGFREQQAVTERDAEVLRAVLRNGIRWAAGVPVAQLAAWPERHAGALLVAEDVESGFANAGHLAKLARERGTRVSFFAVSKLAADYPELGPELAAAGEVGSQTSDHRPVAGLPYSEQVLRLRRSWSEISDWTGRPPVGLRPPEERFDEGTLRAWREVGGRYLLAVNDARSASPEVFRTRAGPIVLLPRLLKDDYNVFVQESALRSESLVEAYTLGMRKVRVLGGLAVLTVHSQIAGTEDRVGLVGQAIDSARADGGWWIAGGAEIAGWWAVRHAARVELSRPEGELEARVSAPPAAGLQGAWLEVFLPAREPELRPWAGPDPLPYEVTQWGLRVPVEDLPPGTTQRIQLRPAPEAAAAE